MKEIENEINEIDTDVDFTNFEDKFFQEVNKGKAYQHFLNLNSDVDCMFIRSVLSSMDIPTYIEGEHANRIFGFRNANLLNIKLYILVEDYDEALITVKDYVKNKIESNSAEKDTPDYQKNLDLLLASLFLPTTQDVFGIKILEKKTKL